EYIRNLKWRKLQRLEEEERERQLQQHPCHQCGRTDHRDACSRLCPHNAHYGEPTRRQRRQQEALDRQRGLGDLRQQQANYNIERCAECVDDQGRPDDCLPHASRASRRCHNHITNIDDVLKGVLGNKYHRAVRKCTLKRSSITNQNVHLPTDTAEVFEQFKSQFTNPNDCCVAPLPGYSPCLAHLAKTIEVININAITETFESRCLRFIAHRIRQLLDHEDWPSKGKIKQIAMYVYKVLADNPDDPPGSPPSVTDEALIAMDEVLMNTSLGPTPINHQTLAEKIDIYTSILWDMLE
ncbi:hypothetical protein DFQ30_002255, partial [Apophysomyces sp. BC1015]